MEASFWHQRWEQGNIGFHEGQTNPLLANHYKKLNLEKGSCLFLPLCGKTRDIAWLLAGGYRVVGAELSELAIHELFSELGIEPKISKSGKLVHYTATDIDIFVGDFFDLSVENLGLIDAIYDRAALVALPTNKRKQYTTHLINLSNAAPQLLITYEYDQHGMDGPPFSVTEAEIKHHYAPNYQVQIVERVNITGGLKGAVVANEIAWVLQKANG
ncbi:MAG: thiopurine S-methyltransferase [Anaerolineae bacterium]|nr:thiopurine S-methyltransferase [Anaerolineae bacterium]